MDESDNEEYIGVKLGLFGTKSTLIPMEIVRVNEAEKAIEVSDSKDHVQDAPTFGDDDEVTAEYEDRIRSHFGLESLASASSRGYGAYSGADTSSGADYDSDESTARSSETSTVYRGDGESREYAATTGQEDRTDGDSSSVDTEYGERTDSATTSSSSSDADYDERSESPSRTSASSTSGVSAESFGTGESTGERESSGTPSSRRTEETETVEEGGRTKVRRRIVTEEIIEEEQDS